MADWKMIDCNGDDKVNDKAMCARDNVPCECTAPIRSHICNLIPILTRIYPPS